MATGINEKSKQNPRFLYSSDRSKNVLRVRSRPVGLQPPLTASTISTEVGDGKQYGSSRDFTAATGLVPVSTALVAGQHCLASANEVTKRFEHCF